MSSVVVYSIPLTQSVILHVSKLFPTRTDKCVKFGVFVLWGEKPRHPKGTLAGVFAGRRVPLAGLEEDRAPAEGRAGAGRLGEVCRSVPPLCQTSAVNHLTLLDETTDSCSDWKRSDSRATCYYTCSANLSVFTVDMFDARCSFLYKRAAHTRNMKHFNSTH